MDLRIDYIFKKEMKGDTSFTEKSNWFSGTPKYTQLEVKDIWERGIKYGLEIGLRYGSNFQQVKELNENTIEDKHKEFLQKFHKLAKEYDCYIQYHPEVGLKILSNQYENNREKSSLSRVV